MIRLPVLALAGVAALAAASPVAAQERVPSEPVPTPWTLEPDTLEPFVPPPLPGLEEARIDDGDDSLWHVELNGFFGVSVAHYNRVDGLVPAWGGELAPTDPGRTPAIGGRVGFATTHSRTYWDAWIRQRLPIPGAVVVEAGLFQRAATFDEWKLSRRENDVATFVAASDLFDWWREKGFRVRIDAETPGGRIAGSARYLDATQFSEPNRSPFALLGDDDFEPNPAVADGELRSVELSVRIDTRDVQSPLLPSAGWWIAGEWEAAGGALGGDVGFSRGMLDVRRYNRIGDDAWWDWRLVWMGPLGDDDLPAQRRMKLGGPGSLRGFRAGTFRSDDGVQGQTEVRLPLPVNDTISLLFLSWHAIAFADAGAVGDLDEWHGDVGLGVSGINILSYLGFFVAQRVTDFDAEFNGPRFVVRLRRDF